MPKNFELHDQLFTEFYNGQHFILSWISSHQSLFNPLDPILRVRFCRWARRRNHEFFRHVLFSDESTFNNRSTLNWWNFRFWADQNPRWLRQIHHHHRWSLNVWCGITDRRIIGLWFFDRMENAAQYLCFSQYVLPKLWGNLI